MKNKLFLIILVMGVMTSCSSNLASIPTLSTIENATMPIAELITEEVDAAPMQLAEQTLEMEIVQSDSSIPQPVQLTSELINGYHPRWSPDGSTILFTSANTGSPHPWIIPVEGGSAQMIDVNLEGDYHLYWAPDSTWYVFDAYGTDGSSDVWRQYIYGGEPELVVGLPGISEITPVWSPDGAWIAYVAGNNIWLVPSEGGEGHPLTAYSGEDWAWHPTFSPDGQSVVFALERDSDFDLWMISVAGGEPVQLTGGPSNDDWPSVSPDGRVVAFQSDRDGAENLWLLGFSGDNTLLQATTGTGMNGGSFPHWSPDGTRLVFASMRGGGGSLWIVDVTFLLNLLES